MKKLVLILAISSVSIYSTADVKGTVGGAKGTIDAGTVVNAETGDEMSGICSSVVGAWACPIAVASFVQVGLNAITRSSADKTISAVDTGSGDFSDPNAGNPNANRNDPMTRYEDKAREGLKKLKDKGYSMNPDGSMNTPKGKVTPQQLQSGKALADAGIIDEADILKYDNALKAQKKKLDKIVVKSMGSAKGGYAAKRRKPAAYDAGSSFNFNMGLDKSKIKAAKTSGLTKNFGGDPIGVATDDIFRMLGERYDSLEENSEFITNAAGTYPGQR